jgi:hypothetical protein
LGINTVIEMTNFEKIKSMSVDELAAFLWEFDLDKIARDGPYFITIAKLITWLRLPSKD